MRPQPKSFTVEIKRARKVASQPPGERVLPGLDVPPFAAQTPASRDTPADRVSGTIGISLPPTGSSR
jgi:hypothetical protein